jgi:hypothetical protein
MSKTGDAGLGAIAGPPRLNRGRRRTIDALKHFDRGTRMAETQGDAKRFFVAKVLAEAQHQGVALSESERQMLSWSESDPEFKADPALVEQLAAEISDEDYEAKIRGLLEAAYRRDVGSDAAQRDAYRHAYSVLKRGDHYLLVMIDQALGRRLRPWWRFSLT